VQVASDSKSSARRSWLGICHLPRVNLLSQHQHLDSQPAASHWGSAALDGGSSVPPLDRGQRLPTPLQQVPILLPLCSRLLRIPPVFCHGLSDAFNSFRAEDGWIMDGDLGPYDAVEVRLRAADTIIFLDFSLIRCAWRAVRRSGERADFWRWLVAYRFQSCPILMKAIANDAAPADLWVLRDPRALTRFVADVDRKTWSRILAQGPSSFTQFVTVVNRRGC
jgi:hypothetical protein